MSNPIVGKITRHSGVAGQFSYSVEVTYQGEESQTVTFVGSSYGGPIVMIMPSGHQVFVSSRVTDRIGTKLDPTWVRRFFGQEA